jgi:hypothetical protein
MYLESRSVSDIPFKFRGPSIAALQRLVTSVQRKEDMANIDKK